MTRKMKDSGIEWIGMIPEGWSVGRVKHYYHIVLGKMLQPNSKSETDELLPYMCAVNITWKGVDVSTTKSMWFSKEERQNYKLHKGDLLVTEGGDVAVSCIWNDEIDDCYIQNAVHRVRPKEQGYNRFLYYWMNVLKNYGYIDMVCNKATLAHFTKEKLEECIYIAPIQSEQTQIADYLDAKCAEIDALITAKEKSNTLLKEYRQSIIFEAVTKGLDPHVPMKDSGIEWIGMIPEGWNVMNIKRLGKIATGSTPSKENLEYWDGDIPWISSKDMKSDFLTDSEDHLTVKALDECGMKVYDNNTLLFCVRSGILRHTFPVAVAIVPVTINQDIRAMEVVESISPSYLLYYLKGINSIVVSLYQKIGATVESIEMEWFDYLPVLLPSKEEQLLIIDKLKGKCAEIDALIEANEKTITQLKEYRQSVIFETVTGKLEV